MNGKAVGPLPTLLRGVLGMIEPFYAGAVRYRNWRFDSRLRPMGKLGRPVISIGNITTGGTGKTPVIEWLATRLREQGRHVAILSRGYKSAPNEMGDELTMLDRSLNRSGLPPVYLRAHPNRVLAGQQLLTAHPEVDVVLLDDGFQHRRLARDLDIVLINAAEPFGWNHVLPRGMLREPLAGLKRAGAFILTHADQVAPEELTRIEKVIRRCNPNAPTYRAAHAHSGLRAQSPDGTETTAPMSDLNHRPFYLFCGIGNPDALDRQLSRYSQYKGRRFYADHHRFSNADLISLDQRASQLGAQILLTTEKDWVKVAALAGMVQMPIWRIGMELNFQNHSDAALLSQIAQVLIPSRRLSQGHPVR
jgi:tetraacyldisaccharide 4'-kinase